MGTYYVKSGKPESCGCKRGKHRHTGDWGKSPTYRSWQSMIARCGNPSSPAYAHYKKRGITVCARWRKFENFLADMGVRPEGKTLDREDNDKNYEPGNCRWATKTEQGNNRITNLFFEYRGERFTLANLARHTGVKKEVLRCRLCRGKRRKWTVEEAVETPVIPRTERWAHRLVRT